MSINIKMGMFSPCSRLALSMFAPCLHRVLFLHHGKDAGGEVFRPVSKWMWPHRFPTLFSPCSLSSPLARREGGGEDSQITSEWTCSHSVLTMFSPCSHLVLTVFCVFTTSKEGGVEKYQNGRVFPVFSPCCHLVPTRFSPCSHRVPTMFAPWSHLVLFLHPGQGGRQGGFSTNLESNLFSPSSHRVRTVFSACSRCSPLAGR